MGWVAGEGRVAIVDGAEGARRVMRALRRFAGDLWGQAVAIHAPEDRDARFVREADQAVERTGSWDELLKSARVDALWLGPSSLDERRACAAACERAGVTFVGPPAAALRAASSPEGLAAVASEAGVALANGAPGARRLEVLVARDRAGGTLVIGAGEATLRDELAAVLVESPPHGLEGGLDLRAASVAERVAAAAGWVGLCAVRLAFADGELALEGLDAFAEASPAIEAASDADAVRLALRIAAGGLVGNAPFAPPRAHAVAARLTVAREEAAGRERPEVALVRLPSGPGIQASAPVIVGDHVRPGDPVAVVLATGDGRADALARLDEALAETDLLLRGGTTTRAWVAALAARPEVRAGAIDVDLLARLAAGGEPSIPTRADLALLATAVEAYEAELDLERARFLAEARRGRPRVGPSSGRIVELRHAGRRHRLEVRQTGPENYRVSGGQGGAAEVHVERLGPMERRFRTGDLRFRVLSAASGLRHVVEVDGVPHRVDREPAGIVASPMPAVVVAIPVTPGQPIEAGEPIARIESMKVEVEVKAPVAGVVREVVAIPNTQVEAGDPLVRMEPLEDAAAPSSREPVTFAGAAPAPDAETPEARYRAALVELDRLLLGFDLATAEARRLGTRWRELSAGAGVDAGVLAAEERALRVFVDVQSLFGRARLRGAEPGAKPPLEELWRYLHEPEKRGAGLAPAFVTMLERALSHYEVSLDAPGRELELALLRLQKAYERADDQVLPILGILERRLALVDAERVQAAPDARELLDRLATLGQERFPAVADLARELRYRRFDQPELERIRQRIYAQARTDLDALSGAEGERREEVVRRLVDCPQPLASMLVRRMAEGAGPTRPRLVETLLRRYYRNRPIRAVKSAEVGGVACATAEYEHEGVPLTLLACFAPEAGIAAALEALARLAEEVPAARGLNLELYVWSEAVPDGADAQAAALQALLAAAPFRRTVRRAAFVVVSGAAGADAAASQRHFTFREGAEDRRYRGVHPMLFRRLQLGRLAKFELERQPTGADVYLYRGVAQGNPKDERLFAAAEVRDLTPIRDASGRLVQLPQLERVLHEALAGMRRFQARRAPHQRLEWNRVQLTVTPTLELAPDEIQALAERLAPATEGLGLEMVSIHATVPDPATGGVREALLRVITVGGGRVSMRWDDPTDRPLEPMAEYQQRVVQLRRRGLTHPFEVVRLLAPPRGSRSAVPHGEFQEYDLDASNALVPVNRPPGSNAANMVVGVVTSFTDRHPEGMRRVILLGDPSRAMGSLAEPECRRIAAAIALAEELGVPLEWFAVSAGAKISMESGTENMDWISLVLRRIVEFTQRGGEINVIVCGINVGAQPYWNAEATMLMHTRGILVMVPGSAMVLTGKEALQYSGSVSAEDNEGIGGYDRIMGPNGQAQYQAASIPQAIELLIRHYDHCYVTPGERFPRKAATADPRDRDVRFHPHGPEGGAGFGTVGDVFSATYNPDRKKPFDIRRVMSACVDQDHAPLERWRDLRGGETAVVWDAHLGGWPVCLIGIESRPLPRLEFVPADGPEFWSAGTLFPQSSKKIARAVNGASGNRPLVVLANLSGFDGSPESMRRLQLEYGAEIGRAVVNFQGPIVFCVVSRYHGGAFVVFSKALREDIEVVAVEGARASVIGGAPAAAVVFAREVETRTRKDPRVAEAEKAAGQSGAARARLADVVASVRSEKVGEVAEEFDAIHTVERALKVGSLDAIIAPAELRPWLIGAVERGMKRAEAAKQRP